jgi:hypothetical protein
MCCGHRPRPLRPVIFSMQFDEIARCLHAFKVPRAESIFTMGGSWPYRRTFSSSAATLPDFVSYATEVAERKVIRQGNCHGRENVEVYSQLLSRKSIVGKFKA